MKGWALMGGWPGVAAAGVLLGVTSTWHDHVGGAGTTGWLLQLVSLLAVTTGVIVHLVMEGDW